MTPKNYAYYNIQSGLIENVIWVEDEVVPTLTWPEGYAVVVLPESLMGDWSTCGIGWSYMNGEFIEPPMPEPKPQPVSEGAQNL